MSASLGITASAFHAGNFTTVIDATQISSSNEIKTPLLIANDLVYSDRHMSASLGITGSSFHAGNFTTVIDTTHVSSSLAISASSFWVNGVELTSGGGGGTPGGSDSQIQYNNGGSFGGEANFVYDDGNDRVGIGNSAPTHTLSVTGAVAVTVDVTITGSMRATEHLDIQRIFFQYGSAGTTYLPLSEGNVDDAATATEKNQFVAPFSGRLKRLMLRTANSMNSNGVTASIVVSADGVADFNAGGSIIQHVTESMPASAARYRSFNFSGSQHQFIAGDIVGIKLDFGTAVAPGNSNVTLIWSYNTTEDVLS